MVKPDARGDSGPYFSPYRTAERRPDGLSQAPDTHAVVPETVTGKSVPIDARVARAKAPAFGSAGAVRDLIGGRQHDRAPDHDHVEIAQLGVGRFDRP